MSNYPVYEPTKQCSVCKGKCCQRMPGHYSPTDFSDLSFEGLKAQIEKGNIAIDWWSDDGQKEYYLRARHQGEDIVHGSWGGICMNLSPAGCRLSWEERPLGCRSLKPRESSRGDCLGSYSKKQSKEDWKAYDSILRELVAHFGKEIAPFEESMNNLLAAMDALSRGCLGGLD